LKNKGKPSDENWAPRRIGVFYQDFLESGGFPRETELLAESLARSAEDVVVYCLSRTRGQESLRDVRGFRVRSFYTTTWGKRLNAFTMPTRLRHILLTNSDRLDSMIVFGSFLPSNVAVTRCLRASGIPYFLSPTDTLNPHLCHGLQRLEKAVFANVFERRVAMGAAGIRFYSTDHRHPWEKRGYIRTGQSFILHEGIDREQIDIMTGGRGTAPEASVESSKPYPPIFGFLGRLAIYQKGLDLLLVAWAEYKGQGGAGTLEIRGSDHGRDRRHLQALAHRLDLPDVDIGGPVYGPDKAAFLRRLTVLVHPSRHESAAPRVTRESLAMGVPMIVTRDTNVHELVEQFGAGWVVEGEWTAVAQAMWVVTKVRDLRPFRRGALAAAGSLDYEVVAASWLDQTRDRIAMVG
jgi:glycosyltransferase involved in cell wall biosynthesis